MQPLLQVSETDFNYPRFDGNYAKLISALTKDERRNHQIATDAVHHVRYYSGTVLIASDRIKHCKELEKILQAGDDNDTGFNIGVLTGNTTSKERQQIINSN